MGAFIIKAFHQSCQPLKELAERLAIVTNVRDDQYEDFILGPIMDSEKT
jgi:hypothetical protein